MKQTAIILYFLIFSVTAATAQGLIAGVSAGYGSYRMKDLKSFQDEFHLFNDDLFGAGRQEHFPGYVYYSASVGYQLDSVKRAMLDFSYHMTGGRNYIADYSGFYLVDFRVRGYRIGISYQQHFFGTARAGLSGEVKTGMIFSGLKVHEELKVYQSGSDSFDTDLTGVGLYVEPAAGAYYRLNSRMQIDLMLGYEFDFPDVLRLASNTKVKLSGPSGDRVRADWSGLRVRAGIVYQLNTKR